MAAPLPLLAFKAHVGPLFIAPDEIDFVAELGVGELALVELGRWRRADGLVVGVVVKGWKPHVIATPQDFRELLLEASKLQRLRHPHICRFLGLGCFSHGSLAEVRESMFMVEEYVGTRSLRKLIGEQMRMRLKNLYSMAAALRWAAEVADALALLHEAAPPYIHGDVKADNVLLTDGPDVDAAHAKLGDLKPHRHVYDRAPSTLSQHTHQQLVSAAKHPRQGSLAKFSEGRGSSCSSSAAGSCPGTPSGLAGCQQLSSSFSGGGFGTAAAGGGGGAESCVARLHSMPMPISARGGSHGDGGGGGGGRSWADAPAGADDGSSCAGAGAAAAAADGAAAAGSPCIGGAAAAAGSPAGEQQLQPCIRRRLGRALGLSDSASSTTDSNGSVCIVPPRGVPSLAAASDDADDAEASTSSSTSSRDSSACDEPAAQQQQQQQQQQQVHALPAPASSVVRVRCCSLPKHERCACGEQQQGQGQQEVLQVSQLLTSKSAPAQLTHQLTDDAAADDCDGVRDRKVHAGAHLLQLQEQHQQQQQVRAPPSLLQQQLTGKVPSLSAKAPGAAPLCQPLSPPTSPPQQPGGWALSPSGAASPCGAIKSGLLDLFADMTAEEEVALSRRWRDRPCQYTLVPGSLVQQRLLPSPLLPSIRSHSDGGWEQHAAAPPPLPPAAGSEQPVPLLAQASSSSSTLERVPSLGKSGAPAAIESKQHGGNSAFAALTAIDVIAEETSSLATESVMGSCCTSRESTAHGGSHFFDSPLPAPAPGQLPPTAHLLQLQQLQFEQQRLAVLQEQQDASDAAVPPGSPRGLLPLRVPAAGGGASDAGSSSGADAAACSGSGSGESPSPPLAATAVAAGGPSKRVRFAVERPAGATPSRDFGLLYTAPELLKGHRPTEKVDVFAFGVLLYELFSRSLVVSQCAAVCAARGSGRGRRRGSKHSSSGSGRYADSPREQQQQAGSGGKGSKGGGSTGAAAAAGGAGADADDAASLPEQQLMLAFAQKVAGGFRLPLPPHFPAPVAQLIGSCWAVEPHERPRMADVLGQLRAWQGDAAVLGPLDAYCLGLADLGYAPKAARPLGDGGPGGCGCAGGCVIS